MTSCLTRPASAHPRAPETNYDLLSHAAPLVHQGLVVGIVTDRHSRGNVTLLIAVVLGG
jgi:hypothetical protein